MFCKIIKLSLFLFLCVNLGYASTADFEVRVIYFKTSQAEEMDYDRYHAIFRKIQVFFRDEMVRHGYDAKTVQYEMDSDRVKVHTITAKHDGAYYSGNPSDVFDSKIQHEIPFNINPRTNLQARQHHYILILAGIPLGNEILNGAPVGSGMAWAYPVGFGGGTAVVNTQFEEVKPGFYEWLIIHEFIHTFRLVHSGLLDEVMGPIAFGFPKYISKGNADKLNKHRAFSVVPIIDDLTVKKNVPKDAEFVNLTFTHDSNTSLTPVNNPNNWDGWVAGIWEKTPDGETGNKSVHYWDFDQMDIWSHWMYSSAPAEIEYDISSEGYTKFSSFFGVPHQGPDFACEGGPSVQLVVYADNTEIYRSDVLYRDDHGVYIEFDIPSATKTLTLKIGDVENQSCDNYIFGEPKLYIDSAVGLRADSIDADVNNDGRVDLLDVQIVRKAINGSSNYDTDVNNDGVTDEADIFIVKAFAHAAIVAASPGKRKVNITTWAGLKRR